MFGQNKLTMFGAHCPFNPLVQLAESKVNRNLNYTAETRLDAARREILLDGLPAVLHGSEGEGENLYDLRPGNNLGPGPPLDNYPFSFILGKAGRGSIQFLPPLSICTCTQAIRSIKR